MNFNPFEPGTRWIRGRVRAPPVGEWSCSNPQSRPPGPHPLWKQIVESLNTSGKKHCQINVHTLLFWPNKSSKQKTLMFWYPNQVSEKDSVFTHLGKRKVTLRSPKVPADLSPFHRVVTHLSSAQPVHCRLPVLHPRHHCLPYLQCQCKWLCGHSPQCQTLPICQYPPEGTWRGSRGHPLELWSFLYCCHS